MKLNIRKRYELNMNTEEMRAFIYVCNPCDYEYGYYNLVEDKWQVVIEEEELYEEILEEIERFINKIDNDFEEDMRVIDSDEWDMYSIAKEMRESFIS